MPWPLGLVFIYLLLVTVVFPRLLSPRRSVLSSDHDRGRLYSPSVVSGNVDRVVREGRRRESRCCSCCLRVVLMKK